MWIIGYNKDDGRVRINYAGQKSSKNLENILFIQHFNKIFGEEFLNDAWNFIAPNYVYTYNILKNSNYNDSFQVNSNTHTVSYWLYFSVILTERKIFIKRALSVHKHVRSSFIAIDCGHTIIWSPTIALQLTKFWRQLPVICSKSVL